MREKSISKRVTLSVTSAESAVMINGSQRGRPNTNSTRPLLILSLPPNRQNTRSKSPTKGRAPKRIYTGVMAGNLQDENGDIIIVEGSQRPRRPYIPSRRVMATLLRDPKIQEYDILALQELWRNPFTSTTHNPILYSFHLYFPKDSKEAPARVCFFVNRKLDPNSWRFTEHTRDLTILDITIQTPNANTISKIVIHNVYNPPKSSDHRESCLSYLRTVLTVYNGKEQIIIGDFNLHYELWGDPTTRTDPESDELIDIIEEFQLVSLLPAGIVIYDDKNRPERDIQDWARIDEKELRIYLVRELPTIRCPKTKSALDRYIGEIVAAIQIAINHSTLLKRWSLRARAGWSAECKEIHLEARRLKHQNSREHTEQSWEAYRIARNRKGRVIRRALLQGHRE
ncbi:reverse transcriptase protein [Rutstroemia sp. NJR-2017a WRK4]|nr:reverse transcriptase protein [Rutstroemia sp. NJR-2017a WRK4]